MGKTYSVKWLDEKIVMVEVDGVEYKKIGQIPDEKDRSRLRVLMARAGGQEPEISNGGDTALPKIIFQIFLGVSILMWVIFAVSAFYTGRGLAGEESTVGVILELTVRKDSAGNDFYYPRVEFTLPDGTRQRVQLAEGSFPPAYYPGQQVKIGYNPTRPLDARIQSSSGMLARWTLPIITAVLGVCFALAAAFAHWMTNQPSEAI